MGRLNVYVPDDLAARSRAAGLNVSALTQQAIIAALAAAESDTWLSGLGRGKNSDASAADIVAALDVARDEFGAG